MADKIVLVIIVSEAYTFILLEKENDHAYSQINYPYEHLYGLADIYF